MAENFRKLRRKAQELTREECADILKNGDDGVLSVAGDNGYPYGIPLNYLYDNGKIYFHCAKTGHKIDAIKANDKVSFCVIGEHTVLPKTYETKFTSVVVFGRARIMDDPNEMYETVQRLALKYCPDDEDGVKKETEREFPALRMIEITPEHICGKKSKCLL